MPSARRLLVDAELLEPDEDDGRVARSDVEQVVLTVWRWRDHLDDVDAYWLTGRRAADLLGVNSSRLRALTARGFLPYEVGADGCHLYRSAQLRVIGSARRVRWSQYQRSQKASP